MVNAACGNCQYFEPILNKVGVCSKGKEKVQMLSYDHCNEWVGLNNA